MADSGNDIILKLTLDAMEFQAKLAVANDAINKSRGEAEGVRSKLAEWGMVMTGVNQTFQMAQQLVQTFKTDILAGTQELVLKSNFKGDAEDMELFKKAVAGTVTEGGLVKLSNYATDLGINIKQQPILFNLAKQASDKYGTSTEEGFNKIILASEGSTKAIKSLGIENKLYLQIVSDMAAAHGGKMTDLDAETQKQIRLDAILQASKLTMTDVMNARQNDHDKIVAEGVAIDEAKNKFGAFIASALMPFVTGLREAGGFGDALVGTVSISGTTLMGVLPILMQYKTYQALAKTETIATTAAIEGETAALGLSGTAILGIVGLLGVLCYAYLSLDNAMDAVKKRTMDSTFKNWVDEMALEIDKMDDATARWTEEDNKRQQKLNEAKIEVLTVIDIPKTQNQNTDSDGNKTDLQDTKKTAPLRDQIATLEMQNRKLAEGNKLIDNKLNPIPEPTPPVESEEKTYEQKVKDYLDYYEGLAAYDKKYQQQYQDYLDEQNIYYTQTLLKKRGSMDEYSNEEIAMMVDISKKIKKPIEDRAKAELDAAKSLNESKTNLMKEGYDKDSQVVDDWLTEQMKKEIDVNGKKVNLYENDTNYKLMINQEYENKKGAIFNKEIERESKAEIEAAKKIADAKLKVMPEGPEKEKATIENSYTEDKSVKIGDKNLYDSDRAYKLAVDQKYYDARLALAKKNMIENSDVHGAMLAGYDTFMGDVLRKDMTGAEKKKAIWDSVTHYLWKKLTDELADVITTEAAKLIVYTANETGKTVATTVGETARAGIRTAGVAVETGIAAASVVVHTVAEAEKTTTTEIGVGARIALIGAEIVATLAGAAASMVNAVASIFEWEVAAFGPFALATIPASIASMVVLYDAAKSAFGFDQGGLLKKGERGYFEGNRNEIIAPEDNFIDVMNKNIIPKVVGTNQMSIMNLLNQGHGQIITSMLNANNVLKRQGDPEKSNFGDSKKIDQLIKLTEDNLTKHDQVITAFQDKQFMIDLWSLRTQQKKIDAIYDKLAIK